PLTALGAMASFILWEEQLRSIAQQETLRARFSTLPCRVSGYIREQRLLGTELDQAHVQLHAIAELEEQATSVGYREAREAFLYEVGRLIHA
ncbi:MAG: hypothetical protein P8011_12560, partial [Acidihalobacter sp.]